MVISLSAARTWPANRSIDPAAIAVVRYRIAASQQVPSLRAKRRFHGEWIATESEARLRLLKPLNLETTMLLDHPSDGPAAIRTQFGAIFVSLELSRSTWLITSLSPGQGEKMSRHSVKAGAVAELMKLFAELNGKAQVRTGLSYPIITIQEAGLDGFWLHRVLKQEGIESHVVDPASIATPRRKRRAKTDRLDGETLLRALLAYKRGEPRVCAMVAVPSPEEEDRRRLCRERQTLIAERIEHVNRIMGLLFAQGISDYAPVRRDRRARLMVLRTAAAAASKGADRPRARPA